MKFVHIADMHFDTPFISLENKTGLGNIRRKEQKEVFKKIIEYIKMHQIEFLFISGDLYESKYINKETIEYINNLFSGIPKTNIFISPGNHDPVTVNSYYNKYKWGTNVHIFKNKIERVGVDAHGDPINIYGYGFNTPYSDGIEIENIKLEDKSKINILIIHGTLDASKTIIDNYNPISAKKLEEVGFDYVALGHVHKSNGVGGDAHGDPNRLVYPGSTVSLGFDEQGAHGMIVGEITKENLNYEFIQLDNRVFIEKNLNVSEINDEQTLIDKLNELKNDDNQMYKIILEGARNFKINIKNLLNQNVIKIKDTTKIKYNLEEIEKENNLRGLFIKEIKEMEEISEEEKEKAIEIGLEVIGT